jgi:hypothetical protein
MVTILLVSLVIGVKSVEIREYVAIFRFPVFIICLDQSSCFVPIVGDMLIILQTCYCDTVYQYWTFYTNRTINIQLPKQEIEVTLWRGMIHDIQVWAVRGQCVMSFGLHDMVLYYVPGWNEAY